MLDKLFDAFREDPDRMVFKCTVIFLSALGGGFLLMGIAAVILVLTYHP